MNKFSMKKLLSILLCIALIAALALSTVGCSKNDKTEPVASAETSGGTVSMGEEVKEKIYSVSGKLVNGLKRGVNIIRGNDGSSKKVVVK